MNLYTTPDQRWQAVACRDTAATGHFVYAVRTTGVYCHPGCKSVSYTNLTLPTNREV